MKINDIIKEDDSPDVAEYKWEQFQRTRESAVLHGKQMIANQKYQLFVPRGGRFKSVQDRQKDLLGNRYAWDDDGNLNPNYAANDRDMYKARDLDPTGRNEPELEEDSPPILSPSRGGRKGDWDKPTAILWTSTAKRHDDKSWSSRWTRTLMGTGRSEWVADYGYLYEILPTPQIVSLNSKMDVEHLVMELDAIGRIDNLDWDKLSKSPMSVLPWPLVGRYFDGVHHSYPDRDSQLSDWEVESTAWLSSDHLKLLGKVPIYKNTDDEDYY